MTISEQTFSRKSEERKFPGATRLFTAVLHLHLGFSWNSFHALRHFLDHESIDIKLQSLAHPLCRLTRLATLRAHFTRAY